MGRMARSWELFRASWGVLKKDKELLVLPFVSGVTLLAVASAFFLPMIHSGWDPDRSRGGAAVFTFFWYVASYTIGFYFQAALVAGALERLSGGTPTLGSCLAAASRRLLPILVWGLVAGTVGMVLRALQERSGLLGKIVVGLLGMAWSLATFFMVPVLVVEGKGVGESFTRSKDLFKKTWGETVTGSVGLGLFGFLGMLCVFAVAGLLAAAHLYVVALVVGALGFISLMVLMSALSGIYLASLYRYATTGEASAGFDQATLERVFG